MFLFIQHLLKHTQSCLSQCLPAPQEQSQDMLVPLMHQVLGDSLMQMNLSQLYTLLYSESTRTLAARLDQHDPLRKADTLATWRMLLDMDTLKRVVYLQRQKYRFEQVSGLYHWLDDSWDESSDTYFDTYVDAVDSAWTYMLETRKQNHISTDTSALDPAYLCYSFYDGIFQARLVDEQEYRSLHEEHFIIHTVVLDKEPIASHITVDVASQSVDIPVQAHLQLLVLGRQVSWLLEPGTPPKNTLN